MRTGHAHGACAGGRAWGPTHGTFEA